MNNSIISDELSPIGELSEIAVGINAIRCFEFDDIIEILVSMYFDENDNPPKQALIDWIIIQSINKRPKGITRRQQITLILPLLHPKVKIVCIELLDVMREDEDINEYI
jgi:hypothetical protein